jgi:dCMP deaminase
MNVAQVIAQRSQCSRKQVGAVVVTIDERVAATGYNGPPAGWSTPGGDCSEWCPRARGNNDTGHDYTNCVSVHAEMNALLYSSRRDVAGGTLYVTTRPCLDCAKAIANSGVVRVVWPWGDTDPVLASEAFELLRDCGIRVERI